MITAVKGMNDIIPGAREAFLATPIWQHVLQVSREVLEGHGYLPVWLPVVEDTQLFARLGEDTDVVSKEMYTFKDRGDRSLTLRPEGTAGAARAYVEHHQGHGDGLARWYYAGPMFRAERPQKGRYRQFYQIGAEFFGAPGVAAEAELLGLLHTLCQRLGLQDVSIRVNTLGDAASRQAFIVRLQTYLGAHLDALCESCGVRLQKNPLRVLDCKRPGCRDIVKHAPDMADSLSAEAAERFAQLARLTDAMNIPTQRDPQLVRGLDYYNGMIFEFTTGALGAQDAILGGGRYDKLVADLGGPPTPAVGFAAGLERLALLVAAQANAPWQGPHLYVAPMGSEVATVAQAFALAAQTRQGGAFRVEVDVSEGRLKQQLRRAARLGARFVLVLGANELQSGRGKLKDLNTSTEHEVALDGAALQAALAKTFS